MIIKDLNNDDYSDALVCLGRYGSDKALYFDAYIWNEQYEDIAFEYVENFRNIPNPRIAKGYAGIIGRHGNDQEKWEWSGQNKIKKSAVTKDYYK